jgi:anaerobic nitric oxide reductase transcription regulator
MINQQAIDQALGQIATDLANSLPGEVQFQRLVSAIAAVMPADAVGLFRLQGQTLLPVASIGLAPELQGRRFELAEHPRLRAIIAAQAPVHFPSDSPLPDPFDGLLACDAERMSLVHACMGCGLYIDGEVVGALTFDALAADAFDDLPDSMISAFAALAAASLRNVALIQALERACEHQRAIARDMVSQALQVRGNLIGQSALMQALRRDIAMVAQTQLTVLIMGETGTGKELVMRTLHAQSQRAGQALVQINCAALSESVVESELFGHRRGAFTGAVADRAGKFELAHGGTLFLDEIGELPLSLQAKLLRALQQGEVQRVGADEVIHVDVRVVAATNRNLAQEVEAGRFRADLYHRLHVFPLHVPALREHREDIPELAGHFLDKARSQLGGERVDLSPEALEALVAYDWPGNVRELEHLLLRSSLCVRRRGSGRGLIRPADLGLSGGAVVQVPALLEEESEPSGLREAMEAYQCCLIERALLRAEGNWSQAARALKTDRANLQRLARRLGVGQIDSDESN